MGLAARRAASSTASTSRSAPSQAASALGTVAAWRGTVLNHDNPILETELPIDGSRFEGIVSPAFRKTVWAPYLKLTAPGGKKPCVFRTTFLASMPS